MYEYKYLDGWSSCNDYYMSNPSTCDCEWIRHVKLVNI